MSARCPEGHLSDSLDYCDVCGSPMGAGGPDVATPGPELPDPAAAPQSATQTCPHCGALNVADALFCEACGYDFTTGTPPMGAEPVPSPGPSAAGTGSDEQGYGVELAAGVSVADDSHDTDDESASTGVRDDDADGDDAEAGEGAGAEAEAGEGVGVDAEGGEGVDNSADGGVDDRPHERDIPSDPVSSSESSPEATEEGHSALPTHEAGEEGEREPVSVETEAAVEREPEPEPERTVEPGLEPAPAPAERSAPSQRKARHTPPSRALAEAWVVELWVDPDWYAVQQTEEACPSAGVPDIVLLTRSAALVGRPSGTLGVQPEVDAGADSAVSRRHAQLTSDGQRWWVEDLGSSNGTFVGTVGEPLPTTPITPGQRVEIDRDDRLYVGAWTRIVLRQATASEQQGTG